MAMVRMELTPLGDVMLWILVVGISGPFDGVSHTFHDGYNLYMLDVEVVFWYTGVVDMGCNVLSQLARQPVEWMTSVASWLSSWSSRVRLE